SATIRASRFAIGSRWARTGPSAPSPPHCCRTAPHAGSPSPSRSRSASCRLASGPAKAVSNTGRIRASRPSFLPRRPGHGGGLRQSAPVLRGRDKLLKDEVLQPPRQQLKIGRERPHRLGPAGGRQRLDEHPAFLPAVFKGGAIVLPPLRKQRFQAGSL